MLNSFSGPRTWVSFRMTGKRGDRALSRSTSWPGSSGYCGTAANANGGIAITHGKRGRPRRAERPKETCRTAARRQTRNGGAQRAAMRERRMGRDGKCRRNRSGLAANVGLVGSQASMKRRRSNSSCCPGLRRRRAHRETVRAHDAPRRGDTVAAVRAEWRPVLRMVMPRQPDLDDTIVHLHEHCSAPERMCSTRRSPALGCLRTVCASVSRPPSMPVGPKNSVFRSASRLRRVFGVSVLDRHSFGRR